MNVILIYPEFPDTFWSFKHALPFIRKKASLPPLGLLTVAGMLPAEWNKRLVDLNVKRLTRKDLAWADLAFISGMAVQKDSARRVIDRLKEAGLTVVAGGPLFTMEHEAFETVDHFVLNEGELTLPVFLEDFIGGHAQRIYSSSEFADMRKSPVPLWNLADMNRYASMSVQFSRGCPFQCDFCNVTSLLGHRPRTKTPGQIIAELDSLYRHKWRGGVFFVDDNLIGNKALLKDGLLPALIRWRKNKKGFPFNTEISINLADDGSLAAMMADAGFDSVFIGIETPNENSLRECGKTQNLKRDLVGDVKRIQRAGLQVQGGFIVGFDSDTDTTFQRLIDFIQRSGIVTAMVGMLQAFPGTRLHDRLKSEGRLLDKTSGDNADGTTNIVPAMNMEVLQSGYRNLMNHIYSPEVYYRRIKTFLNEYRPKKIKTPLGLRRSADYGYAFLSSVLRLGIAGKERAEYWRLVFWALWRRPNLFPLAVTLAVYGYHFRRICELHID
ncbi:DUF4070 domain-containing protein [bacterium]|nr:DUF4070 domain-containing protein [bacterium]